MRRCAKYLFVLILLPIVILGAGRPMIKSVRFQGNEHYSDRKLRSLMGSKQSSIWGKHYLYRDLLLRDVKSVLDFYYRYGLMDAELADLKIIWNDDSSAVDILIKLNEGNPLTLDSVIITGADSAMTAEISNVISFKPNDRLNFDTIAQCEKEIVSLYGDKGFLAAVVSRKIIRKNYRVEVVFNIDQGPRYYLGEVQVAGNEKTKSWFVKKDWRVKTGNILTLENIQSYRQRLFKKGIFKSINISAAPTNIDSMRDLQVEITEKEAGEFSIGGGYGSEEGPRLSAEFGYINLQGQGSGLGLETLISSLKNKLKAEYSEPYFMRGPLFFKSSVGWRYQKEPSFHREETEAQAGIGCILSEYLRLQWSYSLRRTSLYHISPDLAESLGKGKVSMFALEAIVDRRDSKVSAAYGDYFQTKLTAAEPYLLGKTGYYKAAGDYRRYLTLFKPLVLASQMKSGYIFRLKGGEIPLEEKFFLGGAGSVRGFDRNSLGPATSMGTPQGGNYYYLLRFEARAKIWKTLTLKTFFDNGGLFRGISSVKWEGSACGTGLGLTIAWGVWTARAEYAWKIENDFLPGKLYLEVGQAF